MKISEMTDTLFAREMEKLVGEVQYWLIRIHNAFGPDNELKLSPVSYLDGTGKQPFPLALELKELWDYARGTGPRPDEWRDIVQEICELMWAPIAGTSYNIPVSWRYEPLGFMCLLAEARAAYEAGASLNTEQLAALSGYSQRHIRRLCTSGEIQAEWVDGDWVIPSTSAHAWMEEKAK